jgi:hypothetical protein
LLKRVIKSVEKEIYPFMPQTSVHIQEQIAEKEIKKGKPLFPRIEIKKE